MSQKFGAGVPVHDRLQEKFNLIRQNAIQMGLEPAISQYQSFGFIKDDEAEQFRHWYKAGVDRVGEGGPVMTRTREGWYPGAQSTDPTWSYFVNTMEEEGKDFQLPSVHESSDAIVGLTPDPAVEPYASKGLVVGFIQSGKTTNFTAVAAKLADRDYRMVIVLAGIHNALRRQTQDRLYHYLIPANKGRWFPLTSSSSDFDLSSLNDNDKTTKHDAAAYLRNPGKTSLLVVKKNHVVLKKLLKWLSAPEAVKALQNQQVLIIDDEADQASVATRSINPLIREILQLMPRSTYIGYTASPFANVFIDPNDSTDLYPKDFIYSLPQPEGYFGPEVLFGRDVLDRDSDDIDGYDMIREIPEEDEFLYRPKTKDDEDGFAPTMTNELRDAISWFVLATAARWGRQGPVDSSMLIHTSFKTKIHESYESVIQRELDRLKKAIDASASAELNRLEKQWVSEGASVPASDWGRETELFADVMHYVPHVLNDVRIVIDNSKSEERLDYDEHDYNTIIAVGGNTLSRGITLEGLVSSIFLRPTNTYDTLLQMGRWFGFRNGYEDLPRIWTTDSLRRAFRHLSLVEHEMRSDINMYQLQHMTPMDAAVRIRTHPSLRVTAKMGAAQPARTSYSGARLQVRYYKRNDLEWLENNWDAGLDLVRAAERLSKGTTLSNGSLLFKNVPVGDVLKFLDRYEILPDQADINREMLEKYITERNGADHPQLTRWNIAIRSGQKDPQEFAGYDVPFVNRAPLKDPSPIADIGTLMTPQDLVIDMPEMTTKEAKSYTESELKLKRLESDATKDNGLLVLYPIHRNSEPTTEKAKAVRYKMGAPMDILGLGLVFPQDNLSDSERASVRSTHMSVDVSAYPEEVDIDEDVFADGSKDH
ncbi:Z1 domain-containing protein [Corynebacterium sp. L4756]|uniref:Z1 domain-containing protein n=1 Tax=unclassified Corynebacterium TaxID=2624378 RepID=UPI00374DDC6E